MVKIPHLNTYRNEHFEMGEMPGDLAAVFATLNIPIKSTAHDWTIEFAGIKEQLMLYWRNHEKYIALRKTDLTQTTLFCFGANLSSNSIIPALTKRDFPTKLFCEYAHNWKTNIEAFDVNMNMMLQAIHKESKARKMGKFDYKPLLKCQNSCINGYLNATTHRFFAYNQIVNLDNLFYELWLLLNKKIASVEDLKLPNQREQIAKKLQALKSRCMSLAGKTQSYTVELSPFFEDETREYLARILDYHYDLLDPQMKKKLDPKKELIDSTIKKYADIVKDLQPQHQQLKSEVLEAVQELFQLENPAAPAEKDCDNQREPKN